MTTATATLPRVTAPIVVPPDLFARAWANLAPTVKLSDNATWWVERHDTGCWLVAASPSLLLTAWVPVDPADTDVYPTWADEPDDVFGFVDIDKRVDSLCRHLVSKWGKAAGAPGFDEYLQLRPGQTVSGAQLTLDGMARSCVSVWSEGERHDMVGSEEPAPPWRTLFRTFTPMARDGILLGLDQAKALCAVKGFGEPKITFGAGTKAMVEFMPVLGDTPRIFGLIYVGQRPGDNEPSAHREAAGDPPDLKLVMQSWDGGWADNEESDDHR